VAGPRTTRDPKVARGGESPSAIGKPNAATVPPASGSENLSSTLRTPQFETRSGAALHTLQSLHAELRPHLPALIGVSGGRDSVALLHFLFSRGWTRLIVCHLNHGLRGHESGQDAAFVRRFAEKNKLVFEGHSVRVAALAKSAKLSLETCARAERDAFFHRMTQKHHTPFVFLAHHAEDQAETVLGNLCRGAGLHGLSGMNPSSTDREGLTKLRPLLEVRREDVDAYIKVRGLAYREDSSNTSLEHQRNRLRREALPMLREVCQRDVVEIIVRCARFAGRDEAFLRETALRLAQHEGIWEPGDTLRITDGLKHAHPAVQARVLRHWLVKILKVKGVGAHEIEGALGLLNGDRVAKLNLSGGAWVRRKAKRLFLEQSPTASSGPAPVRKASI
jgi:tRNA(Ile)-lysidine synthase